jgi:Protein of unknown function (DUF4043)
MAEVVLATALQKQTWSTELTTEYVRESGLMPYMGTEDTSIIRIRMEHKEQSGDTVNFPLVQRIKGRGVRGSEVLKGNEADLGIANTAVKIDWIRQGVKLPKSTTFRTAIDMWGASKPQLRSWSAELLRDDTLSAMNAIIVPGTLDAQGLPGTDSQVTYPLASAAQRNTFLAQNSDRIVFGNARANIASGNFATSLGNVTIATGLASAAHIRLLKQIAKVAGQVAPAASLTGFTTNIRPYKSDMTAGREYFVYFVGTRQFAAYSLDASILAANTNARAREGDGMERNPLFQDGDLIFQGVIIREVPEIDNYILVGAGGAGADVAPGFLCGQSAICVGYGMRPQINEDLTEDYSFRPGMAITELRGIAKTSFGGMQYGIVTSMVAVSPLA